MSWVSKFSDWARENVLSLNRTNFPYRKTLIGLGVLKFSWDMYLRYRKYQRTFELQPEDTLKFQSAEEYGKGQLYARQKQRLATWSSIPGFVVGTTLDIFLGRPALLAAMGQRFPNLGFLGQQMLTEEILELIDTLMAIPFDLVDTFRIETEFGFNRQTPTGFGMDLVKGKAVSLGLTVVTTPITYMLFEKFFTPRTWIYFLGISLGLAVPYGLWIHPRLVEPLFNTFTPLEEGELRTRLEAMANEVGFPSQNIVVVDGSQRSSHSQAYVQGMMGVYRIVLFDTLLNSSDSSKIPFTNDEIVAIVGHELGHWKLSHGLKDMAMMLGLISVQMMVANKLAFEPQVAIDFGYPATIHPMIAFGLAYEVIAPINWVVSPAMSWISRRHELEADAFAARLGFADGLCSSLEKLSRDNLGNLNPDPLSHFLDASHPLITERIAALTVTTE